MFDIAGMNKKLLVGVTVTPHSGLEACVYDKKTNAIVKYGKRALEYNLASKEIMDPNALRTSLSELFDELQIQKEKANAYFVLPNVMFGFKNVTEPDADSDYIENMIVSEASASYIFKKEEPSIAWTDVNAANAAQGRYIAYSAFQKKAVEAIEDACMDTGINLAGIESSASAIPRGIALTGACEYEITNDRSWLILLVNPNNYSIFQVSGTRILDYIEIPFATMSFDGEEVYMALSAAARQYIANYSARKLVVVSQSDNVSSEILKREISFDGDIVNIETNGFAKLPPVNLDPSVNKQNAAGMTLCALGAACPGDFDFVTLNVMGDANYDGVATYGTFTMNGEEVPLTSSLIISLSIKICAVLIVLVLIFVGGTFGANSFFAGQVKNDNETIKKIEAENKELNEKLNSGIGSLIKSVNESNKSAINFYDSLSLDIPSGLWLNYYFNKNGSDVAIVGYALSMDDIYDYYKSLKVLAPKSNIKLNKLEVFSPDGQKSDIDSVLAADSELQIFFFEISNTTYVKTFDSNGNRLGAKNLEDAYKELRKMAEEAEKAAGGGGKSKSAKAARIPIIPDVEQ